MKKLRFAAVFLVTVAAFTTAQAKNSTPVPGKAPASSMRVAQALPYCEGTRGLCTNQTDKETCAATRLKNPDICACSAGCVWPAP